MKVLFITPDFNYACGRSYYIFSIIKNLEQTGIEAFLVTNQSDSLDRLKELNIPFVNDQLFFKRSIFGIKKQINVLTEILADENVDVVHSCQRFAEFLGSMAAKRIKERKIRTVFTALSYFSNRYFVEFKSDIIISVSNAVRNNLINRYKVNPEIIHLIPNFVSDENISHNKPERIDKMFNLLTVARFHKEKGIDTLLNTMRILKDKDIHLTLIGDGELKNYILSEIAKHNLNITVVMPKKDLSGYYSLSDLCVLPSVIDPFPTFMLQAGLYKVPFIGSDISGINELIVDGVNGFLFTPLSSAGLAEKIIFIKNHREIRESVSGKLYDITVNNYTDTVIMPKLVNIYKNFFNCV